MPDPVDFWSYARHDDALFAAKLNPLQGLLSAELGALFGAKKYELFRDTVAIDDGADWAKVIPRAIDDTDFLIPTSRPAI